MRGRGRGRTVRSTFRRWWRRRSRCGARPGTREGGADLVGLIDVFRKPKQQVERSQQLSMAFNDWASVISSFQFGGGSYTIGGTQEDIGSSYTGVARGAFMGNGIVFACMANRMQLFSEARFMYRRLRGGRPGDTFSLPDLDILRTPWTGGTTGDLLARMILHADIAGNAYVGPPSRRPVPDAARLDDDHRWRRGQRGRFRVASRRRNPRIRLHRRRPRFGERPDVVPLRPKWRISRRSLTRKPGSAACRG